MIVPYAIARPELLHIRGGEGFPINLAPARDSRVGGRAEYIYAFVTQLMSHYRADG